MAANEITDQPSAMQRPKGWYRTLEFVRSAVSTDDRAVFQEGGTLWRDPDGGEHWLHPTTVQRERMVDRARAGITAEQERLNEIRESGGDEDDPMFSEIRARTPPPRGQREPSVTDTIPGPVGRSAADIMREDPPGEHEISMTQAMGALPVSGEWEGWSFHFVGEMVAIDNKPAVEARRGVLDQGPPMPHRSIVVPVALVHAIGQVCLPKT